jgi:hypothetical protein
MRNRARRARTEEGRIGGHRSCRRAAERWMSSQAVGVGVSARQREASASRPGRGRRQPSGLRAQAACRGRVRAARGRASGLARAPCAVRPCASRRQAGLAGRQHSAATAGQWRTRTHGRWTPTRRSPAANRSLSTGTQASGRAPGSGHRRGTVRRAWEYGTSRLGLGLGNWGGLAVWGLGGWLLGLAGCFACGPYWAAPPLLVRCWCAPVLGCGLGSRAGSRARASWLGSARDFYELVKPARLGSLAAREPARACPSLNELEPARRARAFFLALR